jgi:hypothetical protein
MGIEKVIGDERVDNPMSRPLIHTRQFLIICGGLFIVWLISGALPTEKNASTSVAVAADYKTGTSTIDIPPAPASPPDLYNPALGWQTRQPSLICDSYFRVQDGAKAALSGDKQWLAETGCIIVQGGLRLIPLDMPASPFYDAGIRTAWRARLYGLSGDSLDVYLRWIDVVGFANGGTYKSEKEAQMALVAMKRLNKGSDLEHRIMPFGPERVKLWIGPGDRYTLFYFCDAAHLSCAWSNPIENTAPPTPK